MEGRFVRGPKERIYLVGSRRRADGMDMDNTLPRRQPTTLCSTSPVQSRADASRVQPRRLRVASHAVLYTRQVSMDPKNRLYRMGEDTRPARCGSGGAVPAPIASCAACDWYRRAT